MRVTECLPAFPSLGCCFERCDEVPGWFDLALVGVEFECHAQLLAAFEAGCFAMTLAERDARAIAHLRDRAAVRIAAKRDLHWRPHFSEHGFGIERHGHEAHRSVAYDSRLERLLHGPGVS